MEVLEFIDSKSSVEIAKELDFNIEKFEELWSKFCLELFSFNTSKMIAKQNNEKSLEFYVSEERKMESREAKLLKAKELITENN